MVNHEDQIAQEQVKQSSKKGYLFMKLYHEKQIHTYQDCIKSRTFQHLLKKGKKLRKINRQKEVSRENERLCVFYLRRELEE